MTQLDRSAESVTMADHLMAVRRRRWWVVVFTILGAFVGILGLRASTSNQHVVAVAVGYRWLTDPTNPTPTETINLSDEGKAAAARRNELVPELTPERSVRGTGLVPPPEPAVGRNNVYHQFTVRITDEAAVSRDEFITALTERGIGSGIYYPRVVFDYDSYRSHPRVVLADVPNATQAASEIVSLPVHPHLSASDLEQIVSAVREVLGG